jgi:hypothetical protein
VWTSPTGSDPPAVDTNDNRGAMMPKRRHTRADNTAKAITEEQKHNNAYAAGCIAERSKPPPF